MQKADRRRRSLKIAATVLLLLILLAALGYWSQTPQWRFGALPDFAAIEDVPTRKRAFFDYLEPIVDYENKAILSQRTRLLSVAEQFDQGDGTSPWRGRWLYRLAEEYEIEQARSLAIPELLEELILRVDIIPAELALTQAAKESAWGRSRFARDANNLFGQWCYTPGCGIVPRKRPPGARHEVESFESISEAIRRYMNNLNTHPRYQRFRELRQQQRLAGGSLDGYKLVDGLLYYSQRREAYVDRIKDMIRDYRSLQTSPSGET